MHSLETLRLVPAIALKSSSTNTAKKASPPAPDPGAGKLSRIAEEAKGLVEDTREWVDAKLRLFELEFEEKIDGIVNRALLGVVVASVGFLALAFGLTAAALALGEYWGSDALGFLGVAGGLALVALVLFLVRPRFVKGSIRGPKGTSSKKLGTREEAKRLTAGTNGHADG